MCVLLFFLFFFVFIFFSAKGVIRTKLYSWNSLNCQFLLEYVLRTCINPKQLLQKYNKQNFGQISGSNLNCKINLRVLWDYDTYEVKASTQLSKHIYWAHLTQISYIHAILPQCTWYNVHICIYLCIKCNAAFSMYRSLLYSSFSVFFFVSPHTL